MPVGVAGRVEKGVAANEAEWERPPPKPPPLARPVAARAEASGWRAGGGTYERPPESSA